MRSHAIASSSRLAVVLTCVCSLLGAPARADLVRLKNGAEYTGIIKRESATDVTIQVSNGEWTFKRDKIATLKRESRGASRERAIAKAARVKASRSKQTHVKAEPTKAQTKQSSKVAAVQTIPPAQDPDVPAVPSPPAFPFQRLNSLIRSAPGGSSEAPTTAPSNLPMMP